MITKFNKLKKLLEATPIWTAMENTVENSPWHREDNVALHSEMTIDYYLENFYNNRNSYAQLLSLTALLFHDTGKPGARKEFHSEERGDYVRFTGHEKVSARIFEDFAAKNWEFFEDELKLDGMDILKITWMIEYHLPFQIKKADKLQSLRDSIYMMFDHNYPNGYRIYYDMVISDCCGRISDDHEQKIKDTKDWLDNMINVSYNPEELLANQNMTEEKVMYSLIGASGSGKSTFKYDLIRNNPDMINHSWDDLRILYYKDQNPDLEHTEDVIELYRLAFEFCSAGNGFNKYKSDHFMTIIKSGKSLVIDNVNINKKSRAFHVMEAKRKGYKCIAVTFPIARDVLIDRAVSRKDKQVPVGNVVNMYDHLSMPSIGGEFHDVHVITGNL